MAKKVKQKIVKSQTIKEFKAWLLGITEFQSDDWIPNIEQWASIKERVINLSEDSQVIEKLVYIDNLTGPSPKKEENKIISNPSNINDKFSFNNPNVGSAKITLLPEGDGPVEVIDVPAPEIVNSPNLVPNIQTLSTEVKAASFSGKQFKTPNDFSGQPYKSKFQ